MIIHDVFPENLVVTGMIRPSSILYKIVRKFFNVSFNSADKLIACGDDMKEIFQKKVKENVPVSVITNWADNLEVFPTRQPDLAGYYKLEDIKNKITLQFAGNIGRVQGLDRFLKLFLQIENKNVFLVIIGDGAFKSRLLELMISHHTENVLFLPSKPRSEQNTFLNACDIGLVTLSPGMYGLGVPSKVYNILSAGKPVLYIGDYNSEIYRYINLYNVGWAFNWEDSTRITQFLNSLGPKKLPDLLERGNAARLLVEKKFTRDSILKQFEAVLQ